MHDLRLFLVAWGVFALAAALKFARLARQMRGSLGASATLQRGGSLLKKGQLEGNQLDNSKLEDSQKAREQLERIWLKQ
jgi:hypothetical protein